MNIEQEVANLEGKVSRWTERPRVNFGNACNRLVIHGYKVAINPHQCPTLIRVGYRTKRLAVLTASRHGGQALDKRSRAIFSLLMSGRPPRVLQAIKKRWGSSQIEEWD